MESLLLTLARRPKTKTDAKQIIGVINYSASAFEYTNAELARHAELMVTLNAAVDRERIQ